METKDAAAHAHLLHFLKATPPVDFCCVYGSALHSINPDKVLLFNHHSVSTCISSISGVVENPETEKIHRN
ncbi:hypothetical protein V6N13_006173 [Hibiscus sabdariffa]